MQNKRVSLPTKRVRFPIKPVRERHTRIVKVPYRSEIIAPEKKRSNSIIKPAPATPMTVLSAPIAGQKEPKEAEPEAIERIKAFLAERSASQPAPEVCMTLMKIGSQPSFTTCPACSQKIVTITKPKICLKTHVISALLCTSMLFFFLSPLPYFLDSCKGVDHYCPECYAYIGTFT